MTSYLGDESSDIKILTTALHIFRLDYFAKIRSGLCITVLEKQKKKSDYRLRKSDLRKHLDFCRIYLNPLVDKALLVDNARDLGDNCLLNWLA